MIRPNFRILTTVGRRASIAALIVSIFSLMLIGAMFGQDQPRNANGFRIGERLTYNVSFGQFDNVAYAEIYTVSRGKLGGRDAIELRAKIKTLDLVGAAFYSIDESRTTFASAENGYPLYVAKTQNYSVEPKETSDNYLTSSSTAYDLLTLIAKVRDAGGSGSFNFSENDKIYTVSLTAAGIEKVKTSAGEFDTVVSTVESGFLTENGISELKINFSSDDQKVPVLFRFKTKKGSFRAALASIETIEVEPEATPTPATSPTPIVVRTPKPSATPLPYIDNQPLSTDLPFSLGESLEYNLSNGGNPAGLITLTARERKLFAGKDSLLLTAGVKNPAPGTSMLDQKDVVSAYVNPESLTPQQFELKFNGGLSQFSQTAQFDQNLGTVSFGEGKSVDIPIGTHSILSFLYAIRAFNLKPSKDLSNPVNDTRVAVFWESKAYIFTLRPSNAEIIYPSGKKRTCLMVAVITGNPQLDQLGIKIWLSDDARRLPLRIVFGPYQADLIEKE